MNHLFSEALSNEYYFKSASTFRFLAKEVLHPYEFLIRVEEGSLVAPQIFNCLEEQLDQNLTDSMLQGIKNLEIYAVNDFSSLEKVYQIAESIVLAKGVAQQSA